MIIRALIFSTFIVALPASSWAAVIIKQSSAPTVGLSGYTTYTLTAETNTGSIQGFDFASLSSYGFFGSMNQVNPFALPTIFNDNNALFAVVGADVSQDSQFKFRSSDLTVPAGFASESTSSLRAVFAASAPLGTNVPFVQLTVPNAAAGVINFAGQIQTVLNGAVTNNDVSSTFCLSCIPPQIVDAVINNVDPNNPGFVEHTVQFNGLAGTLSGFAFDSFVAAPGSSGTGPAIPATLNTSTRKFNWNTIGSPLGTYKWTFNATNNYGFDTGSITVNVTVPEPTIAVLLGLAFVGCLSIIRRR